MSDAIRLVRDALGDDAVIISTREDPDGVRVTAVVEDGAAPSDRRSVAPEAVEPAIGVPKHVADEVGDALRRTGITPEIIERIQHAMERLNADEAQVALAAALATVFRFDPLPEGRIPTAMALVGPPGVGKTLTIAKLCARAVMANRTVGLVTTDTVRAGGVEQLSGFARLLQTKLITVEDAASLADALSVHKDCDQVWIDTAGRNPFDDSDMEELAGYLRAVPIEPVLVLPAGGDAAEAVEIAQQFRKLGAKRLLPTRTDISRRFGGLLAAAGGAQIAFCGLSTTARVHDGLQPLSPAALAALILSHPHRPGDLP